jgi:iron(III) transport system ATP-binding protein
VTVALMLERVRKHYRRVPAVSELDLSVAQGEVVTLVGPSGCGKSTALRLVAGLEAPDAGTIWIAGEQVAGDRVRLPAERRNVGMCFQEHALFPHLSVAGNVAFGLKGWPAARRRERVAMVLEMTAMAALARRFPHELSGGEQKRVALARALAPEPALVLLDEPFSNLDRQLREQIRAETVAILRRTETASVFVTHDPTEALTTGDRVAVMRAGRIEQVGRPEEVFHTPANRFVATFLGDADFLPARRAGSELVTEIGPVPLPPGLPEAAEEYEVMVRPHEVVLRPGEQGRVVATEFQGGFVLHTLELPSGRTVRALLPHTAAHPVGTLLTAELAPGHPPAVLTGGEVTPPRATSQGPVHTLDSVTTGSHSGSPASAGC